MIREATISGFRMTGKTMAMLDMGLARARAGSNVLFVTVSWNQADHTFYKAHRAAWLEDGVVARSTSGQQRITFPSGGEIRFVSQRSKMLSAFNADTVVLDEFTYYDHPGRTLMDIILSSQADFWLYKVVTFE